MSIIRVKHERSYLCISNQAVRDQRLSFRARGIHHLLLSYPNNWRISADQIVQQTDREGRDAVRAALAELERYGYLQRQKARDPKTGRFFWECVVRELPSDGFSGAGQNPSIPHQEGDSENLSSDGFSDDGFSDDGKPGDIRSTNRRSTNRRSTNRRSTREKEPERASALSLSQREIRTDPETERASALSLSQREIRTDPETEPQPNGPPPADPDPEEPLATPFNPGGDQNSAARRGQFFQSQLSAPGRAEVRFKTGNPYPDLVAAGLGRAWAGPRWTDFLPGLIEAAQRHLRQYNLPAEPGQAKNYLKNLIFRRDWAALELRLQEAEDFEAHQRERAAPQSADPLPRLAEIEQTRASKLQALWDQGEHDRVRRLIKAAPEWRLQVQEGRVISLQEVGLC